MPRRRHRVAALLAVMALVLAAPFERGRGCDICPVDCPMHSARRATQHRCHTGPVAPPAAHPADDAACALRASCGSHHGNGLVVFHADLPPAVVARAVATEQFVAPANRPVHVADGPAPPDRPPEYFVV